MTSQENHDNSQYGDNFLPEKHRVLIVDDEPAICFAYSKLLKSECFGFDVCDSIDAAIVLLNRNEYFAVISDLRFTGTKNQDGMLLVSVVRAEQPLAKIILVTGHGNEELEKTAYKLGASHYFEKPVKPSLILSLLRALHLIADEQLEKNYLQDLAVD